MQSFRDPLATLSTATSNHLQLAPRLVNSLLAFMEYSVTGGVKSLTVLPFALQRRSTWVLAPRNSASPLLEAFSLSQPFLVKLLIS